MNIVICDDDMQIIKEVVEVCKQTLADKASFYLFQSAESLIKNLSNIDGIIDLFILDIEMPGKSGLWLKKELEQYRYGSSIIYLTSHDELVQDAFGRYVIGFVDKISFNKDKNVLAEKVRLFEEVEKGRQNLCLKDDNGIFYIQYDKIIKITSEHVYTYIEYATGKIINGNFCTESQLVRKSLKEWEKELGNDFLRVGKQCIINMEYIYRMDRKVIMKDGSEIVIPRANVKKCMESYFDYCKRKMKWD